MIMINLSEAVYDLIPAHSTKFTDDLDFLTKNSPKAQFVPFDRKKMAFAFVI